MERCISWFVFFSSGIPQEMYVGNGSYTLGLTGVKTGGYHNLTLD